jgi:hypothetical protein
MYSLLRNSTWKEILRDEVVPLFAAGVVAEMFFKWHSFTLETLGFLGVWFVFGWLSATVRQAIAGR